MNKFNIIPITIAIATLLMLNPKILNGINEKANIIVIIQNSLLSVDKLTSLSNICFIPLITIIQNRYIIQPDVASNGINNINFENIGIKANIISIKLDKICILGLYSSQTTM